MCGPLETRERHCLFSLHHIDLYTSVQDLWLIFWGFMLSDIFFPASLGCIVVMALFLICVKNVSKSWHFFLASVASSLVPDRLIHSTDLASVAASLVSDCLIYTNYSFYFYDYTIKLRHSQRTHNHLYQRTYAIHNDSQ